MTWHYSWSGMKGAHKPSRKWMTWREFDESLRILGVALPRKKVREILAADPPAKCHGAFQYEGRHLDTVVRYMRQEEGQSQAV